MVTGCVLIHGFTGSPYELEPLAEHFKQYGWEISVPVLPGHGSSRDDLRMVTWKDWVQCAEEEVRRMTEKCSTVYLIGFSMGGMIAAYLSTKYPVKKLVLLSASVFYINPGQIFEDMAEVIKAKFNSDSRELLKRYMKKSLATPIHAVVHFRRLVKVLKPELSKVSVPVQIIQGSLDDLVEPRSAQYIYEQVQSSEKEIHNLEKSKHMICHDCEKELVLSLVDRFLQNP